MYAKSFPLGKREIAVIKLAAAFLAKADEWEAEKNNSSRAGAAPFAPQPTGDTHGRDDTETGVPATGEHLREGPGQDREGGDGLPRLRDREGDGDGRAEGEDQEVVGVDKRPEGTPPIPDNKDRDGGEQ